MNRNRHGKCENCMKKQRVFGDSSPPRGTFANDLLVMEYPD
jgi:hypothetical protein